MALGAPRASNPLALSEQQGGGSIPLAPSMKQGFVLKKTIGRAIVFKYFFIAKK